MKKLFMFLAVAGLATFGASCSSDDNKNDDPKQKDLVLSGKTDVKEGDAVTFTVKVGDKAEAGTDLYVAGEKVSNPYTFTKKGEFKVQAKKNGFNDSNVLTVKVSDKDVVGPDPKTLVLSVVGGNEVMVGQDVVFLVKDNEGATVTGATIKKANATVANPWTATEAGTFKFVASKDGYENSNEISVVVKEAPVVEENFVKIGNDAQSITVAQMSVNAQNINGQWAIYEYENEEDPTAAPYAIFNVRLGSVDAAGENWIYQNNNLLVVEQTDPEYYLFPGSSENNVLFGSSRMINFTNPQNPVVIQFAFADLTNMRFTRIEQGQSAETKLVYAIGNNEAEVDFNGSLGTTIGVIPVDANGNPVATARSNDGRKVSSITIPVSQLVRKK